MAVSAPHASGITRLFEEAGCSGQLCVQAGVGTAEVDVDAEASVVAASVIKLLIAVEAQRQFATGRLDPREPVRMSPANRTPGPTGFSLYQDAVQASARDLVVAMLTISDNVATDALLARLGIEACNETARSLGLTGTMIVSDLRTIIDCLANAAGCDSWPELAQRLARARPDELEPLRERVHACAALDPERTTRTTARDMCRLLRAIWSNEAAPADACETLRGLMSRQLTRERLATGFGPPVRVSAKSGGLIGVVRNEVGVIDYPDGNWYAAAVFTQARSSPAGAAAINTAIGEAAAKAIGVLRSSG